MATHAVDWDDTLVDTKTQEWQPGAIQTVQRWLIAGDKIIVHSCRANWPEGRQQILDGLKAARLDHPSVTVEGKPQADSYVDNLAVRHAGDWSETEANVAAGRSPKPVAKPQPFIPSLRRHATSTPPVARPTFGVRR